MTLSRRMVFVITGLACSLYGVTDLYAATSSLSSQAQLKPHDFTPPTGTISINGGAAYTNAASVTLTLSATDNSGTVAQIRFSNDGQTYSAPEPYAATKSWPLTAGDETKTVYAKFKDPAGNWSPAATDIIVLDTTPPVVQITTPTDGQIFGSP